MSPIGDITIHEIQLPGAYGALTAAVRYPRIRSCQHGSFLAAVRDFHSKKTYATSTEPI